LKALAKSLPTSASETDDGLIRRLDRWLMLVVYQSGLGVSAVMAVMLILLVGFAVGGFAFVATQSEIIAGISSLATAAICLGGLSIFRTYRMNKFEAQFPSALAIIARAMRAGESLEQAVELVGDAAQEPVAGEFRRCIRQIDMGRSVAATMQSFGERVNQSDVRIFSSTLAIHREGGGNLAESMDRLSSLIRDRLDYRKQMKSVTSGGRFSVMVVFILAPIVMAYLFLVRPEYGQGMWQDNWGRWMLYVALLGQVLGLFWVSRIFKSDY
jgi:tight adherence protein B